MSAKPSPERSDRNPHPVPTGIELRHRRGCQVSVGCTCDPGYRAWLTVPGSARRLRRSFASLDAAVAWREETRVDLRRGLISAMQGETVETAGALLVAGARSGAVRNRSGEVYKPSVTRSYEAALRLHVVPALGRVPVAALTRPLVQGFVDELVRTRSSSSDVRNALMPLRVICRRAVVRGELTVNPTHGLEVPAPRARKPRFAALPEARALISAVSEQDRPIWTLAFFAGLRRGELQGLQWGDLDLENRVIEVRRSWDTRAGYIEPKSRAGSRTVPMLDPVVALIRSLDRPQQGDALVFARDDAGRQPFDSSRLLRDAYRRWDDAGLEPITLHGCRHSFASFMLSARLDMKTLQSLMGHCSITVTLDRYGHLLPGFVNAAREAADLYLARQSA